jgi:hypothetical protein
MGRMAVPSTVFRSITFLAEVACEAYPPTNYTGSLRLSQAGQSDIVIAGSDKGDGKTFVFTAAAATTATWGLGSWFWTVTAAAGGDVFVVATGSLTVAALNTVTTDLQAAINSLAEAEAELKARVEGKAQSYSIKDRSLSRMSVAELMTAISYWRRRVQDLAAAQTCGTAKGNPRITYGSFSR